MERSHEEKTPTQEKSARGGARTIGWTGAQRSQAARERGKWPQGRPGQKPQEDPGRQTQCAAAAARTPQAQVTAAMMRIRARFGDFAIGLGAGGLRYITPAKVER
jgi:hypothetical protein